METYRHTEMSDEKLKSRLAELQENMNINHTEPRKMQIEHELSCVAFELLMREQYGA